MNELTRETRDELRDKCEQWDSASFPEEYNSITDDVMPQVPALLDAADELERLREGLIDEIAAAYAIGVPNLAERLEKLRIGDSE